MIKALESGILPPFANIAEMSKFFGLDPGDRMAFKACCSLLRVEVGKADGSFRFYTYRDGEDGKPHFFNPQALDHSERVKLVKEMRDLGMELSYIAEMLMCDQSFVVRTIYPNQP